VSSRADVPRQGPATAARPASTRRRAPATVLILGILSVVLLVSVWRLQDHWTSRDLQRLHVTADLHNQATAIHLALERIAEDGDAEVGPGDVVEPLSEARTMARALVEGDESGLTPRPVYPAPEPERAAAFADLRMMVERFARLSLRRLELLTSGDGDLAAASADEYESAFQSLDVQARGILADLGAHIRGNKHRSMGAIGGILAGWVLLIMGAAWALWRREKLHFEAEEALRDRESQLLQAQKMEAVGRLAGGIAHDINNYLAAIRGQCELVKMKTGEGDPTRRRMDLVLETSDRASTLIERLLAFSRRQPVERRVVDLNVVISDLKPMMERLIGADLRLQTRPCATRCALNIDPSQLEQVVVNLLVNAREAMPRGGEVTLTCQCLSFADDAPLRPPVLEPGGYVELRVEDTGEGIDPQVEARIFEPFFTTKEDASGLGLPTVYGIVQQNGGTILVDSEPGEGTAFRVLLPRHELPATFLEAGEDVPAEVPTGEGERVLVVDDHPEFLDSLRGLLEGWGYEVETAGDAAQAEERVAAARRPFDLVVTDVVMPGRSGPELVRRLRRRNGPLRALFISGYTGDVTLSQFDGAAGQGAGDGALVVELLHKPFRFETLATKVRQILDAPAPGPPVGGEPGVAASEAVLAESDPQSSLPS